MSVWYYTPEDLIFIVERSDWLTYDFYDKIRLVNTVFGDPRSFGYVYIGEFN